MSMRSLVFISESWGLVGWVLLRIFPGREDQCAGAFSSDGYWNAEMPYSGVQGLPNMVISLVVVGVLLNCGSSRFDVGTLIVMLESCR